MASYIFLAGWIFIGILLLRDLLRRPSMSLATWVPTLMLVFLFSRTPSTWIALIEFGRVDVSGTNLLDQAFFVILIILSLAITISRNVKWGRLIAQNKALFIFYTFFLVSVFWSLDPANSLIRILKDFGCTLIVLCVALSEKNPRGALQAIYARVACILIPLSALLVRFSPLGKGYAHDGSVIFVGACQTKNELGEMLLVSIMFLTWEYIETRNARGGKRLWRGIEVDHLFLVLVGFWLLNLSQSKTSLVALILGLGLILRKGWPDARQLSRLVFLAAVSYPLLVLTGQTVFSQFLAILDRDATFTGRANIWAHITWNTVNPIIGSGFWIFWGGPGGKAIEAAMQTGIPNAHDGYLDIYLDGGLLGLCVLALLLLTRGAKLLKCIPEDRYARLQFAFLVVAIIHNVTESSFARLSGMWFTIVLALIDFRGVNSEIKAAKRKLLNGGFGTTADLPLSEGELTKASLGNVGLTHY